MNMISKMNNIKKKHKIPVMELFGPTIQGEGIMSGTVTHFLRTGGCGLRCSWCDSMFAVDPKRIRKERTLMTVNEIFRDIEQMPLVPYLTLTGGDPCLHERLGGLIPLVRAHGTRIAVETQGQLFPDWLDHVDVVTFSPKGPSSGNVVDIVDLIEYLRTHRLARRKICIKIVIFDEADFEYALHVYNCIPVRCYDAFYFTAGTPMFGDEECERDEITSGRMAAKKTLAVIESQQLLAEIMLATAHHIQFNDKVHLGCQQHVLLWPDKHKGV